MGWIGSPDSKTANRTVAGKGNGLPHQPSERAGRTGGRFAAKTPIVAVRKNKKRWPEIVKSMAQDQRMTSARYLAAMRNPFALSQQELALLKKRQQEQAEAQEQATSNLQQQTDNPSKEQELTPSAVGIVLTGTIIGRHRRVALFDDQVIPEGGVLTVRRKKTSPSGPPAAETQMSSIDFFVLEVRANSVRLLRKGKEYQLQLPSNPIADRLAGSGAARSAPIRSNSDR